MASEMHFDPLKDMWDEDSAIAAAEREIHRYWSQPLKTTASQQGRQFNPSMLTASEILMHIPTYGSGEESLSKVEQVMSAYTAAAISDEGNEDGSVGPADSILPSDLSEHGQVLRGERTPTQGTPAPEGSDSSDPGNPTTPPGAGTTTEGQTLLKNPNCRFQSSSGGNSARKMIENGELSPNMVYILSVICQSVRIYISSGNTGKHSPRSLHYSQRVHGSQYCQAIDIGDVEDPETGERDGFATGRRSKPAVKLYNALNSITGPRRPTKVGGPWNPGWSDGRTVWFTDRAHGNHVHIEHKQNGDPLPPSPATGSTTARVQ